MENVHTPPLPTNLLKCDGRAQVAAVTVTNDMVTNVRIELKYTLWYVLGHSQCPHRTCVKTCYFSSLCHLLLEQPYVKMMHVSCIQPALCITY
jgi:hypothetical protein